MSEYTDFSEHEQDEMTFEKCLSRAVYAGYFFVFALILLSFITVRWLPWGYTAAELAGTHLRPFGSWLHFGDPLNLAAGATFIKIILWTVFLLLALDLSNAFYTCQLGRSGPLLYLSEQEDRAYAQITILFGSFVLSAPLLAFGGFISLFGSPTFALQLFFPITLILAIILSRRFLYLTVVGVYGASLFASIFIGLQYSLVLLIYLALTVFLVSVLSAFTTWLLNFARSIFFFFFPDEPTF